MVSSSPTATGEMARQHAAKWPPARVQVIQVGIIGFNVINIIIIRVIAVVHPSLSPWQEIDPPGTTDGRAEW
jgi:hypothetical protein